MGFGSILPFAVGKNHQKSNFGRVSRRSSWEKTYRRRCRWTQIEIEIERVQRPSLGNSAWHRPPCPPPPDTLKTRISTKISNVQGKESSRRESRKCRTGCRDGLNMHPWGTSSEIFFEDFSAGFHPRDRRFPETLRLAVFLRSSAPCVAVGELLDREDVFGLRGIFGFLSSRLL